MLGLFFSELILYVIAALAGFAGGWRLRKHMGAMVVQAAESDLESLRGALSDAQARKAGRAA
ncbi:MAG: hypothetical protein ABUS57_08590 [Pseudomonadota bacterium]